MSIFICCFFFFIKDTKKLDEAETLYVRSAKWQIYTKKTQNNQKKNKKKHLKQINIKKNLQTLRIYKQNIGVYLIKMMPHGN